MIYSILYLTGMLTRSSVPYIREFFFLFRAGIPRRLSSRPPLDLVGELPADSLSNSSSSSSGSSTRLRPRAEAKALLLSASSAPRRLRLGPTGELPSVPAGEGEARVSLLRLRSPIEKKLKNMSNQIQIYRHEVTLFIV